MFHNNNIEIVIVTTDYFDVIIHPRPISGEDEDGEASGFSSNVETLDASLTVKFLSSVLFLSLPQSEGWPHHGRTFSIYLYPLSF